MDLTPEDITSEDRAKAKENIKLEMQVNAALWTLYEEIILPDGPFVKKDHEYLMEIMSSNARVEVLQKATQFGGTIAETLINIHGCINNRFPKGVAYAMPTVGDVRKYSQTKFAPLITYNQRAIGKYVNKSRGKSTDSAELKKIGSVFIHFIGTTLSRTIDGQKESAALHSFSCDKFVCDELDMMDMSIIEKLRGRFGASDIKQERYLSNPTGENYGINALFLDSDMRYWHRLCPSCLKYTCAEIEFLAKPERIIKQDSKGKGIIICKHCNKTIPLFYKKNPKIDDGIQSKWIATTKEPNKDIVGRQISQLNSVYNDPYELLQAYYEPPEGNFTDVMKYRFGFAYTAKEDQLRKSQVYECCGKDPMFPRHDGPCAMGVDVGIKKHVVIGCRTGRDRYEIVKVAVVAKWSDVHDLARKFNVRVAGIDVAPDIDAAKDFQNSERYQVWLCDYRVSRHISTSVRDEKNKIIKANRTEAMDMTHRLIDEKKLTLPRQEQMDEFAAQVCNPFKQEIKNERTGVPEYRYVGKNDHFRHALNYFALVCKRIQKVTKDGTRSSPEKVISNYNRI